jgi:hypothetical protein
MKLWIKILIGLVIIGIIGALLIYFFVINKPHTDYEKAKADFSFPAKELFDLYKTNKTDAEKKYNGKVLQLTGSVSKIDQTDSLTIIVFVFGEGMFGDEGIRCTMLPKFTEMSSSLQPGSNTVVKGYCTGYNDTDVILEKCSICK